MIRRFVLAALVSLVVAPVAAQPDPPSGFSALVAAIEGTTIEQAQSLQGRQFTLTLPNAQSDDTLDVTPAEAFTIQRVDLRTFRLTISNAEALVARDLISTFKSVRVRTVKFVDADFGAALEGSATCSYSLRFRQKGGGPLDLSKFGPDYAVTWELQNGSAITDVKREGEGLTLLRQPGNTAPAALKLRVRRNTGSLDVATGWIAIPACGSGDAPDSRPPEPQPVPDPPEPDPSNCLRITTREMGVCRENCGAFSQTLRERVVNNCRRTVRCDEITWAMVDADRTIATSTAWADLSADQATDIEIVLRSPYQPSGQWRISKRNLQCRYR